MRIVRGPVDRIENPARPGGDNGSATQLLGQNLMGREPFRDHRAKHALDGKVHLGDEIDGPLLVDLDVLPETRHLQVAGANDGLNGRGEVKRVKCHSTARA